MDTSDPIDVISPIARDYLRLHLASGIGPILGKRLIDHFGSAAAVFEQSRKSLEGVEGIGPKTSEAILAPALRNRVDIEVERIAEWEGCILCPDDAGYPAPLRFIADPPLCLYVRGQLEPTDAVAMAIVGTRRCSHYGREQAIRFGHALASAGFTVVSGLASGIDGHAHRGALTANGRTIAVLGGGFASLFPREHTDLADEIAAGRGAVITESPVDAAPEAGNFPRRNRIIAGLSLGVLVIEAGKQSGAMITARLATEYNREVFAVPGRIDQTATTAGVNGLIRDGGAKLVTCLEDILDELGDVGSIMAPAANEAVPSVNPSGSVPSPQSQPTQLSDAERKVFDAIAGGTEDVERIAETAGVAMGPITAALTSLQLRGLIQCLPGNRFVRRTPRSIK